MSQIFLRSCLLAFALTGLVTCAVLPENEVTTHRSDLESLDLLEVGDKREFSSEQMAPAVDGLLTSVGSYISPMLGSFKPALEGLGGLMWPALSTLGSHMAASAVNGLGNIAANLKPTETPIPNKGDSYDAFVVKIPNYGSYMLLANPGGPMLLSSALGNSPSSSSNIQFSPQPTTQHQKPSFVPQKPSTVVQKPHQKPNISKPSSVNGAQTSVHVQGPSMNVPKPSVQVSKPSVHVSKPSMVMQKPQIVHKPQNSHPSYYGIKDLEQETSGEDFSVGFHDYEEQESDLEDGPKDVFEYNGENNDLSVVEGVSVGRVQLVPMDGEVSDESGQNEYSDMEENE